nr:hypothetical protein [uncultured Agathobacter sp.]
MAGAFVWKLDDTGATQLVSEPADFDSMGFYGYDTMRLANEQMPTIVQQWYDAWPDSMTSLNNDIDMGSENDIF